MRVASGSRGNASGSCIRPTGREVWGRILATGRSFHPHHCRYFRILASGLACATARSQGLLPMPYQLQRFGDLVVFWWETATPLQFLSVALTIVILGWFVSKLGS